MTPWLIAARPRTLTAGVVPVAVGSSIAFSMDAFRAGPALAALMGALLIQVGTNFANDAFDFEKGADGADRVGPLRVTQAGLLTAAQVKLGMVASFALATACGAYLAWIAGWPIIALGLASIASGVLYTGGPKPIGYLGLGDVFVLAFFGFAAVCGTVFVQTGNVPPIALLAALPVGALATAILAVNNLRDRETDARAGKRTLAVRFGASFARAEYVALIAIAYAVPIAIGGAALLVLLSLPLALVHTRGVLREDGAALNARLAGTAKLLAVHGALLALGIAL